MINVENPLVSSTPELQSLIERLKMENQNNRAFMNQILGFVSNLKPIRLNENENGASQEIEPKCAVDYLWAEIGFLQETNVQLDVIATHLRQVIG
jgi:hypothetical protein